MREKYSFVAAPAPAVVAGTPEQVQMHERLVALVGYVRDFFIDLKGDRKSKADDAASTLKNEVVADGDNLVAFHKFEKAHLQIGHGLAQVKTSLTTYVRTRYLQEFHPNQTLWTDVSNPRVALAFRSVPSDMHDVQVQLALVIGDPKTSRLAGRIYTNEARFSLLTVQPPGCQNAVYFKQGFQHQHYIAYTRGGKVRFVRRYVVRGLNHDDSYQITHASDLRAPEQTGEATEFEINTKAAGMHPVLEGAALTKEQMVLSHTRGWKKRFVSTTTTFRPVYSTRGQEFRSLFGKVIIDLAYVPGENIFDMHTPEALQTFHTTAAAMHSLPPSGSKSARTLEAEERLAARDVIRTRELLIFKEVPFAAIRCARTNRRVIAIGHQGAADAADKTFDAVKAVWGKDHPIEASEVLSFFWYGKIYAFYQFATDAAAIKASKVVPSEFVPLMYVLDTYDFPVIRPDGFVRTL